jgi:hypothetical protein
MALQIEVVLFDKFLLSFKVKIGYKRNPDVRIIGMANLLKIYLDRLFLFKLITDLHQ